MSILDQLASAQNRNDEQLNIELATRIVAANDRAAIEELCATFDGGSRAIQSDAIKVIDETASRNPELVAPKADILVQLLSSRNNRLVWGAMTALAEIAPICAQHLVPYVATFMETTTNGSVITQDWGIRALARIAVAEPETRDRVWPYLHEFLATCKSKDLPKHAASALPAIELDARWSERTLELLESRYPELTPAQQSRLRRSIQQLTAS